jgi:hypothetical protein
MNPAIEKLGIGSELQASQLISTLESLTETLAKAIAGDDSPIATQAAAFDASMEFASASSHCALIAKHLRNPPQPTAH